MRVGEVVDHRYNNLVNVRVGEEINNVNSMVHVLVGEVIVHRYNYIIYVRA